MAGKARPIEVEQYRGHIGVNGRCILLVRLLDEGGGRRFEVPLANVDFEG